MVLGPPKLMGPTGPVRLGSSENLKAVGLLTYMAADPGTRYHTGDDLVDLLWPGRPGGQGAQALLDAVRWACNERGGPVVSVTKFDEYSLDPSWVTSDLWAFKGAIRMNRYKDALTIYRGPLLQGVSFPHASPFMDWLEKQRVKLGRMASMAAWREYQSALSAGDANTARSWAVAACRHSPRPDAILAKAMERLEELGGTEEAIDLFEEQSARLEGMDIPLPAEVIRKHKQRRAHGRQSWRRFIRGAERVSGILEGSARKKREAQGKRRPLKGRRIPSLLPFAGALMLGLLAAVAVPVWRSLPAPRVTNEAVRPRPEISPRDPRDLSGEERQSLRQARAHVDRGLTTDGPSRVAAWSNAYETLRSLAEHHPQNHQLWLARLIHALWLSLEPRGDRTYFLAEAKTSEAVLNGTNEEETTPLDWSLLWGPLGKPPSPRADDAQNPEALPPPPDLLWIQANWHLSQGNYERALKNFGELTGDPRFSSAALMRWSEAATALRTSPSMDGLRIQDAGAEIAVRSLLALAAGDTARAVEALPSLASAQVPATSRTTANTGVTSITPSDVPILLAHVLVAWRTGRLAEASSLLERAGDGLLDSVEGPFANAQLASWIALARGRTDEAREHAEKALGEALTQVASTPDNPWGYRNLGLAYLSVGNEEEASRTVNRGLRLARARGEPRTIGKLQEARLMVLPLGSQERQDVLDELLGSTYPWSLNAHSLSQDPRWSLRHPG